VEGKDSSQSAASELCNEELGMVREMGSGDEPRLQIILRGHGRYSGSNHAACDVTKCFACIVCAMQSH
jgi:hypothetical protein